MSNILSQIFYPAFLYCVFSFFIFASVFSFIVGISFALRNATMLRFFEFMNKSYSVRRALKPLEIPHFVEPVLLKHAGPLGISIILEPSHRFICSWISMRKSSSPCFSARFHTSAR